VKDETEKAILADFYGGIAVRELTEKYAERYMEEEKKPLRSSAITLLLRRRANHKIYTAYLEAQEKEVIRLSEAGAEYKEIAEKVGIGPQYVSHIIRTAHPKEEPEKPVTVDDVEKFKESVSVGDCLNLSYSKQVEGITGVKYKRIKDTVKVTGKYKFICDTTGGSFRWIDLYLYTRGCA